MGVGASPVAQWIGIRLPVQETRVRSFVWEDPTCPGATNPGPHKLLKPEHRKAPAPQGQKPLQWKAHPPQLESSPRHLQVDKAHLQQRRPNTAINKYYSSNIIIFKIFYLIKKL